jgi:hypothetical protein
MNEKTHCHICGRDDHSPRKTQTGDECPARVIRCLPDYGSSTPGSDPGTRPETHCATCVSLLIGDEIEICAECRADEREEAACRLAEERQPEAEEETS